jgi:hypothetical protein
MEPGAAESHDKLAEYLAAIVLNTRSRDLDGVSPLDEIRQRFVALV